MRTFYGNGPCREHPRCRTVRHTIPERTDSQAARLRKGARGGRPAGFDEGRYKKRNTFERAVNRLKHAGAVATRYDERGHLSSASRPQQSSLSGFAPEPGRHNAIAR